MYVTGRGTPFTETRRLAIQRQRAAEITAAVAERERQEAAHAEERERETREDGQTRLADYEGQTHQRFLHAGGTESDWRAAWPALKQAWLTDQLGDRVAADVERLRRSNPMYSI